MMISQGTRLDERQRTIDKQTIDPDFPRMSHSRKQNKNHRNHCSMSLRIERACCDCADSDKHCPVSGLIEHSNLSLLNSKTPRQQLRTFLPLCCCGRAVDCCTLVQWTLGFRSANITR